MTTTFVFAHLLPFVGNRPWVDVKLMPAHPGAATHKCLVDTGADYLQLPALAATSVGINLGGMSYTPVSTASGSTSMILYPGLDVEIEGILVRTDVLFDTTNSGSLIAGRTLLLTAFDIAFDANNWHHV